MTYIVLPSRLHPQQTAAGWEISITKGLSWHTLAVVVVRAPVSHTADLKPLAVSSPAPGAMGKAWVLEGKCHKFHSVGRRNAQTILQEAINAPSVSVRLWHFEPCQPQDKWLKDERSCSPTAASMIMTSFRRRAGTVWGILYFLMLLQQRDTFMDATKICQH